jgi:hypothetical protein
VGFLTPWCFHLRSGPAADVITSFQQLLHGGQGCLEALGLLLLLRRG